MTDDRTPPHDTEAEQAVLGACLLAQRIPDSVAVLSGAEFYRPAHEQIMEVMMSLAAAGKPVDPRLVIAALTERGLLTKVGGGPYLHTLVKECPVAGNVGYYVDIMLDRHQRRREIDLAVRITQRAYLAEDDGETRLELAERELASVPSRDTGNTDTLMSAETFISQDVPEDDWVIPGLMARDDRLVLTGVEGFGKTTLNRQLAVCAAAGVDPFTSERIKPMKVLFVDVENPQGLMIRRFRTLMDTATRFGQPVNGRLFIDRRPGGMDLADPKDRRWLHRRCAKVKPDLLVIGPAYKLYIGGQGAREEDLARQVTSSLDHIREDHQCALILEHHSPHAAPGAKHRDVRPIGSSLWLRWPEFGYGLSPDDNSTIDKSIANFIPWRGARDERNWPTQIESGQYGMPWVQSLNSLKAVS